MGGHGKRHHKRKDSSSSEEDGRESPPPASDSDDSDAVFETEAERVRRIEGQQETRENAKGANDVKTVEGKEYRELVLPQKPEVTRPKIEVDLMFNRPDDETPKIWLPGVYMICGEPFSGKTHFIEFLMYQLAPFVTVAFALCPQGEYKIEYRFMPEEAVLKGNVDIHLFIEHFLAFQDSQRNPVSGQCPLAVLLFDDILGTLNFDSPVMKKLLTAYGHYNIIVIVSIHSIARVFSTIPRQCTAGVMAFSAETANLQKMLFENFYRPFFADFNEFMRDNYTLPPFVGMWRDKKRRLMFYVKAPEEIPEFNLAFWKPELDDFMAYFKDAQEEREKKGKRKRGREEPVLEPTDDQWEEELEPQTRERKRRTRNGGGAPPAKRQRSLMDVRAIRENVGPMVKARQRGVGGGAFD